MPRTALAPTVVDRSGAVLMPALVALDGINFNSVLNNGRVFLEVKNTSGGSLSLTIPLPAGDLFDLGPGANLAYANAGVQYALIAAADVLIGPFPPQFYNQADGTVWLNGSAPLQVRVLQLN